MAEKKLSIQLVQKVGCNLEAIDNSDYSSLGGNIINYGSLEFLTLNDEIVNDSVIYKQFTNDRNYYKYKYSTFTLKADGLYTYYKFVIPSIEFFYVSTDDGVKQYNVNNEIYYYNDNFYLGPKGSEEKYSLEHAIEISTKIINYLDIYDNVITNTVASQTFYGAQSFLNTCKLEQCLISLQRKLLLDNGKWCSFEQCNTNKILKNRCDFLLCAIYVLNYLKCIGQYAEAQRILDNLSTCDSFCADELGENNNGCNCG